jgi:predicted RecB family nuclease
MSAKEIKHDNPYRPGLYHDIFAKVRKVQVMTREDLMKHTMEGLGKSLQAANAAVTVILSPRLTSKIGDCRGNLSAAGHEYYMEKLGRSIKAGIKDPQRFRLRWRKEVLEPRNRVQKIEVKAEKTAVVDTVTAPVVDKAEVVD